MRIVDVVCLAIAIGAAGYVYTVKHDAELVHDDRRTLERDIASLSQDVRLLEADLAALEQPTRLQAVVNGLPDAFALGPIASTHYVNIEDIPFRSALVAAEDPVEASEVTEDAVVPVIDAPGALDLLVQQLIGTPAPVLSASANDIAPTVGVNTQFVMADVVETLAPQADDIGVLLQQFSPVERP